MINDKIKKLVKAITVLALATFFILLFFTRDNNSNTIISHISTTITINTFVWAIFFKWLWKSKLFYPWLVPFPNLSGNWKGFIRPNRNVMNLDPIPTEVTITQSFFNIQISIKTGESKSSSIGAYFDIDKDRGLQQLFYSYLNTPNPSVRERSEIHYGTTRLNFDGFKITKLDGEYWTTRETTGEIELTKEKGL